MVHQPGCPGILLDNANVQLIKVDGTYALYADGDVKIIGIPGVSFEGSAIIKFNATGSSQTFDVNGSTVVIDDGSRRFEGTLDLNILEQTLTGTFVFEKPAGSTDILFAVSGGNLDIGDGMIS